MIQRVDVTAEDISEGVPKSSRKCPVAFALKRVAGRPVAVGIDTVCMRPDATGGKAMCDYALPTIAQVFIADFDDGKPVLPFSFAMDVPA